MSSQQKQLTPSHTKQMTHTPTKQQSHTKQMTQSQLKPVQHTPTKQHSHQKSNGVVPPSTQKKIDPEVQSAKRKREQINNMFQSAKKEREAKLATDQQKQHSQKQLNDQQVFVKDHLKEFLDFFVLVKYAVLYYTYGVLDMDKYYSSYHTFKELLKKVEQRNTYDLKSYMKDDNPLTIVTLDKEMMKFILGEMNKDFDSIQAFKNETIQKIYFNKNYTKFKEHRGNEKILVTLKKYYNTFCHHNIDIHSVVSVDTIKQMLKDNKDKTIQDFGNEIAKYIMDHKKDKATTGPKPQTGPTTSIEELKRQLHEMIKRIMEMLHLHDKKSNLQ